MGVKHTDPHKVVGGFWRYPPRNYICLTFKLVRISQKMEGLISLSLAWSAFFRVDAVGFTVLCAYS